MSGELVSCSASVSILRELVRSSTSSGMLGEVAGFSASTRMSRWLATFSESQEISEGLAEASQSLGGSRKVVDLAAHFRFQPFRAFLLLIKAHPNPRQTCQLP